MIAGKNESLGKYKNLEFPYCRKFRRTNAEARRQVDKKVLSTCSREPKIKRTGCIFLEQQLGNDHVHQAQSGALNYKYNHRCPVRSHDLP